MEVWKDIVGYEGKYQVSNLGRVKSLNYNKTGIEKLLHKNINKHFNKLRTYKMQMVTLSKNKNKKIWLVHRLVWNAFNGNIPEGYEIDHINNNPEDNRLDNLQLLTRSENQKKKFEDNPDLRKFWSDMIIEKRKNGQYKNTGRPKRKIKCLNNGVVYESLSEATRELNVPHGNIQKVLAGKRKTAGGYKFEEVI